MDGPSSLKPQTTTKTIRTRYVTFYSPIGVVAGPFTLYTDTDEMKENEFGYRIVMAARPDAPQLQRPLDETVLLFKINIFYKTEIMGENDVEVLVTPTDQSLRS